MNSHQIFTIAVTVPLTAADSGIMLEEGGAES